MSLFITVASTVQTLQICGLLTGMFNPFNAANIFVNFICEKICLSASQLLKLRLVKFEAGEILICSGNKFYNYSQTPATFCRL